MGNIQVKNVYEEVHDELRRRAQEAGVSIHDYFAPAHPQGPELPSREEWLISLDDLEAAGLLSEAGARKAVRSHLTSSIERLPHRHLLARAWRHRHNVDAYDAVFVAVAEMIGCHLVTADRRLASVPSLGITVTLIPEN